MKLFGSCAVIALGISVGFAQAENTELKIWSWGTAAPALEATLSGFNSQHPEITVTVEKLGYADVKSRVLAACSAGGTGLPDIFQFQNVEMELIAAQFPDCAADLTPLGFDAEAQAAFPEFKLFALRQGDRMIGMPWDSGPSMMFYRRDFYENAGVDADAIVTWDDFAKAGEKIQAANSSVTMTNDNLNGGTEWLQMISNEQGCGFFSGDGESITVNKPGCVAALDVVKSMVDAKLMTAGNFGERVQNLSAGTVASLMSGAWFEGILRTNAPEDQSGKWGIMAMPSVTEDGVRAANYGGSLLAIANNSENKEAAFTYLNYALGSNEGQITMLREFGLVPSLVSALDDPYVNESSEFWGGQKIWELVLSRLEIIKPMNGTAFYSDADQVLQSVQTKYLNDEYATAQEAMDDAAKQISFATGLPIAN